MRVFYVIVLLFTLWLNYMGTRGFQSDGALSIAAVAAFSAKFFSAFVFVQLTAVLLLTPAMIAGSIAQERERRTIEYLLASTLSGSEIVLSKFLGRLLQVAALLLAGLPILAIAMMLGGIAPQALAIAFAITLAALVATASLSIGVSVWAERGRDAVVRTYLLLLVFLLLPPLAWGLSGEVWAPLEWLTDAGHQLTLVNPYYAVGETLFTIRVASRRTIVPAWWHTLVPLLTTYAIFSLAVLAWSMASVRRVYRKSIGAGDGTRRWSRWRCAGGHDWAIVPCCGKSYSPPRPRFNWECWGGLPPFCCSPWQSCPRL